MNDDHKTLFITQTTATALTSNEMRDTNQWMWRKTLVAEGKVFDDKTSRNHNDEKHCAADEGTDAAAAKETKHQREHKPQVT